ncbi:MAG: tRNA (N(6)-L-threonylcarbamoyladenosine(37)-C(2))-methylthiotransferase MtaB [Magnetococcus sp. DMHC-8]
MKSAGHAISPARYFTVLTMGCRVNQVETERLAQTGAAHGFQPAASHQAPDVIIINTCSVTSESDRQARQLIRRTARAHPQAQLIVTGCHAQGHADQLAQMPGVVLVVGNSEKEHLWEHLSRLSIAQPAPCVAPPTDRSRRDDVALVDTFSDRSRAFLQVQDGCDGRCTFCAIPTLRGPSRSWSAAYVQTQAERYRLAGYREIVLTGINLGAYGRDRTPPDTLAQLVARLMPDMGETRLRLSSLDPVDLDDDLLQQFADHANLCPYLHLSIQSGDDRILKRMGRGYGRQWVLDWCRQWRAVRPELVLGADLIVGFPTESSAAFQQTVQLVEEAGITFLHVFRYSERPGTPAAAIPGRFRVPPREARRRSEQLRHQAMAMLAATARPWIGQTAAVLLETLENGLARGKNAGFLPVRLPAVPGLHTGQLLPVQIIDFDQTEQTLIGRCLVE